MGDDCARVRAYPDDKDRINDLRQGDDTQADVVARLLDRHEERDTSSHGGGELPTVEQIRSELDTDAPTYDDVKAACAAAIRDELPVEEMGR